MVTHDIETNAVDAVFYPVVPDSFMTRDSANHSASRFYARPGVSINEIDAPILAPHDPWSF